MLSELHADQSEECGEAVKEESPVAQSPAQVGVSVGVWGLGFGVSVDHDLPAMAWLGCQRGQ